jgi:hypothetical protein
MVDGIEVLTDKTTNFKLRSDRYYRLLWMMKISNSQKNANQIIYAK